ncbi:hypothetical protein J2W83_000010 [Pseudomonas hunanensis]|uniref:Uncharacterized protein n=1 Tax=Pseudomonas hunanensis TaxID=1247546 RepID=A0ACC6JW56_9PSED|nr:hypothetical protein [Pseudomonas hunanensis]
MTRISPLNATTLACLGLVSTLALADGVIGFSGAIIERRCEADWDPRGVRVVLHDCPNAMSSGNRMPRLEAENVANGQSIRMVRTQTPEGWQFALLDRQGRALASGNYRVIIHLP